MSALTPDDPDMLTREQAAELLGVKLRKLHYMRKEGQLPRGTVVTFRRPYGGYPLVRFRKSKLEALKRRGWVVTQDTPKRRNVRAPQNDTPGEEHQPPGE